RENHFEVWVALGQVLGIIPGYQIADLVRVDLRSIADERHFWQITGEGAAKDFDAVGVGKHEEGHQASLLDQKKVQRVARASAIRSCIRYTWMKAGMK